MCIRASNIPAMFGDNATKPSKNLRLIINLQPAESFQSHDYDRLYGTVSNIDVMNVEIPEVTIPVAPGRNLAVLVEGAVRNHLLRNNGYNAADQFIQRQSKLMDTNHQ
ncbi:MAG: hypothetical protein HUJ30_05820 [Gammaproteobacteria bacterium]|nr:hypothetical protein [Gammaproteobacteria bacterium]